MAGNDLKRIFRLLLPIFLCLWPYVAPAEMFPRLQQWERMHEAWANDDRLGTHDRHFTLEFGGLTRHYNVHLPPNYDPKIPLPVVIYLHGGGGSIAAAYNDKMDQSADRLGFILVIPAGTGKLTNHLLVWNIGTWADNACCGYAYQHHIDDVGFISKTIDEIKATFAVDDSRIYATGISNGGLFSYLLGCALPGKIAAVAPVAPPGIPDGCTASGPVSLIHVHGTGDPFAKYDGGKGGSLFSGSSGVCFKNGSDKGEVCTVEPAEQQLAEWLKKDRCSEVPRTVYHNGAVSCYSYDGCAKSSEVEFCRIEGGGHAWPSGAQYAPASKIGPVSYDMSFDQIWDFLKRHRLQKQR